MDTQNDGPAGKRTPAVQQMAIFGINSWNFFVFFPSMKGWRIDFHHSSNVLKQSTGEANKNTMLHPNKAEHSQIHIWQNEKKTEHFPKHFVLEDFPKFSQVKLSSPLSQLVFFLHQSNTGIKACVVVAALSQQLGVIIPPMEPGLFIHHPAWLGGWIWKNEMEKTHREIHSQRPFLCFFCRIFGKVTQVAPKWVPFS